MMIATISTTMSPTCITWSSLQQVQDLCSDAPLISVPVRSYADPGQFGLPASVPDPRPLLCNIPRTSCAALPLPTQHSGVLHQKSLRRYVARDDGFKVLYHNGIRLRCDKVAS